MTVVAQGSLVDAKSVDELTALSNNTLSQVTLYAHDSAGATEADKHRKVAGDALAELLGAGREYFPTIANNSTDAEHDLDIGAARIWVSDGSTEKLIDFTAMTKRIDAAWAAGTNQGGLDTGTVAADTWYYIWAIYNPTTDTADWLLSASTSSPTLPGGYTFKRSVCDRIAAAVLTDGSSNILNGAFEGTSFLFTNHQAEFDSTFATVASTLTTVSVPAINCNHIGYLNVESTDTSLGDLAALRHHTLDVPSGVYRAQVNNLRASSFQSITRAVGSQLRYNTTKLGAGTLSVKLNTQGYQVI